MVKWFLNKTSLKFIFGFAVIILAVLAITVVGTYYFGDEGLLVEDCPTGESC